MTHKELYNHLQTLSLPVAYESFDSPVTPPYLVFIREGTDSFNADNYNYFKMRDYRIELYSKYKDFALEEQIESLFDSLEIPFTSDDVEIEDERLYETIYYITIY